MNFGNILCLEFEIIVFIQGNLKYKSRRIYMHIQYSVRRAAWRHGSWYVRSRLKLTWIDSRFNPVWKFIPFERALNAMQYMWIWQHSYIQHWRKLCFYIENCLIKTKQLMNMMICSCRGAIRSFVWIEGWIDGWMWGVLHSGTFSWRCVFYNTRKNPSSPS